MSAHKSVFDLYSAPYLMTDPGAGGTFTPNRQFAVLPVVTAAAEARTQAQPTKAGLICAVVLDTDGGDLTLTVTGGYNQAGTTSIVFGDAGDWVLFYSVKVGTSYYWRVLGYEGTGLTLAEKTVTALTATTAGIGTLTLTNPVVSSSGAGAKNGASVAAAESGDGIMHKTVLTCTATPVTFGDEAGQGQYGGVKVYDFPDGLILVLGAVIDGTVTLTAPAINNWDGDVGLGVEAPTDHQDSANKTGLVMNKNDVSAGDSDKIGVVKAVSAATALTESGARHLDGTATAKDLFLNFLVDDNAAHDNTITGAFTGTITFHWINLGDK